MQRMLLHRRYGLFALAGVALAATVWGQSTSLVCSGPTQAGCGPATANAPTTPTTSTTTTTLTGAGDWTSFMVAAWMLDEASGTRVNLQGTTSRNLTEQSGTIANDTTNKMEGTAAALLPGTANFTTSDATLIGLPSPFTCGAWSRKTGTAGDILYCTNTTTNGFELQDQTDNSWLFHNGNGGNLFFTGSPPNTWQHTAVRVSGGTSQSFHNGVANASAAQTYVASTATVFVVGGPLAKFTGQIDEVWCAATAFSNASICRICSCGVRGEQCACSGTAFSATGRNATACGSCTLPADCTAPPS